MQLQRTTVRIHKPLYKQAKKLAVEQDKSIQEILNEALRTYLDNPTMPQNEEKLLVFRDKHMGYKLNRLLTRKDLY